MIFKKTLIIKSIFIASITINLIFIGLCLGLVSAKSSHHEIFSSKLKMHTYDKRFSNQFSPRLNKACKSLFHVVLPFKDELRQKHLSIKNHFRQFEALVLSDNFDRKSYNEISEDILQTHYQISQIVHQSIGDYIENTLKNQPSPVSKDILLSLRRCRTIAFY